MFENQIGIKTSWFPFLFVIIINISCDLFREGSIPICDSESPKPTLKLVSTKPATDCFNPDGELKIEAENGNPPYRYSLEGTPLNFSGEFKNISAGEYSLRIIDASNCESVSKVTVGSAPGMLSATSTNTPDNSCFSDNGTISVTVKNGFPPYQYKLDELPYQSDSVFYKLKKGVYRVIVKDAENCRYQFYSTIEHGFTGVSYRKDVQPILTRHCNSSGCHNGDAGNTINFTEFRTVWYYGSLIVRYAGMEHRQPPISKQEIDYIRCWVEDGKLEN